MAAKNSRLKIINEKRKSPGQLYSVRNDYFVGTNCTCRARSRAKASIQPVVGTVALCCCASGMLGRNLISPVHSHLWSEKGEEKMRDVKVGMNFREKQLVMVFVLHENVFSKCMV